MVSASARGRSQFIFVRGIGAGVLDSRLFSQIAAVYFSAISFRYCAFIRFISENGFWSDDMLISESLVMEDGLVHGWKHPIEVWEKIYEGNDSMWRIIS